MSKTLINISAMIKSLRENSGFTQKNIADYLKVDQSLISKFESGERPINVDMLEKLAVLFGVEMSAFSEESNINPLSFALRASEISEADLETISAINKIALNSNFMTKLLEGGGTDG